MLRRRDIQHRHKHAPYKAPWHESPWPVSSDEAAKAKASPVTGPFNNKTIIARLEQGFAFKQSA